MKNGGHRARFCVTWIAVNSNHKAFTRNSSEMRTIISIKKLLFALKQPRLQGLPLVKNGGRKNPWPRLLKYSKNGGVFCHVTYDEMAFSEVVSSVWWPCLLSCNLKLLFKRNEDIS